MGSKAPKKVWQVRFGNDGCTSEETDTVSLEQPRFGIESTFETIGSVSGDPYSSASSPVRPKEPGRTLDDMRKLDAEMKQARATTQSPQHAALTNSNPSRPMSNAIRGALARWFGAVRS